MPASSRLALDGLSAPKPSAAQKKIDVAALLKKGGKIDDAADGAADTLEMSGASKKLYAQKGADASALPQELKELVEFVDERNRALRPRVPCPGAGAPDTVAPFSAPPGYNCLGPPFWVGLGTNPSPTTSMGAEHA
jgi:hypothetical protein